jgi:recyclin-1
VRHPGFTASAIKTHRLMPRQAPHVDLTDFLNPVVREKKRFENLLDDSVAKGLNAGIEVLMNQVSIARVLRWLAGLKIGSR